MANLGGKLKSVPRPEYNQCTQLMKLLMMPFVCFWAFGFPDGRGIVETISGFVVPAFFVLSGYCILFPGQEMRQKKLKRAIARSAIFFAQLFIVYIGLNVIYFILLGGFNAGALLSKRLWFNFFVLNLWPLPIGDNIWFIQALLYAYIILLIVDKLKLLKFYKVFLIVLFLLMLFTGELAGVIHFNILGYTFIPGGAITRALPYLLLGMFLREIKVKLVTVPLWVWLILLALGGGAAYGEAYLLSYTGKLVSLGHFFGYGLMAVAVCGLCIAWDNMIMTPFSFHGGEIAKVVYAVHNPVYFIFMIFVALRMPQNMNIAVSFGAIFTLVVSLILGVLVIIGKIIAANLTIDKDEEEL